MNLKKAIEFDFTKKKPSPNLPFLIFSLEEAFSELMKVAEFLQNETLILGGQNIFF